MRHAYVKCRHLKVYCVHYKFLELIILKNYMFNECFELGPAKLTRGAKFKCTDKQIRKKTL